MKKWQPLESATAPDGSLLTLFEHDGEYIIRVGGIELMSTRKHHSEDQLADIVCLPLQAAKSPHVLIGGLGFGFTLKAALRSLGADAHVVVAELMTEVIAWNKNPAYNLAREALNDKRVTLKHGDVMTTLRKSAGRFDAIMLDVDNGADAFTTSGNAQLYRDVGIQMAAAALRPTGRVAYWSARPDKAFEKDLKRAGLSVQVTKVRAHATSGGFHTLFVAARS